MRKRLRKLLLSYIPNVAKASALRKAPFLYDLLEIRPTSCNIILTNRCNLRCVMCGQWRQEPGGEITTEGWKGIIADLKANSFRNIHFTGGEPLLRKDLAELVGFSAANGFVVGLTTNGMLLNRPLLDSLVASGLRSIALSVDATGPEYERIRGSGGTFDRLKRAAEAISGVRRSRAIDAYVNFTLFKDNLDEFEKVKTFADALELPVGICLLDKVSCIFDLEENKSKLWISDKSDMAKLENLQGFIRSEMARRPRSLIMNFPGIEYIRSYFEDPRQEKIPCVISQDRVFIGPNGDVFGGCLAMGVFGNIKTTPFADMKISDKYRSAKKRMFYKKCPGCSCGYLFNIMHMPGLLIKDVLQRAVSICRKKN